MALPRAKSEDIKKKSDKTIVFSTAMNAMPTQYSLKQILIMNSMKAWLSESIYLTDLNYTSNNPAEEISDTQYAQIKKQSLATSDKIRLSNTALGIATFANEFIAKDSMIIYAGEVHYCEAKNVESELVSVARENDYVLLINNSNEENLIWVDAKFKGNIGRFIQHAPETKLIKYYKFDPVLNDQVASANTIFVRRVVNGKPFMCVQFLRDVMQDEIITVNYGFQYWQKKKCLPDLFYRDGKIINSTCYKILPAENIEITLVPSKEFTEYAGIEINNQLSRTALEKTYKDIYYNLELTINDYKILMRVETATIRNHINFKPGCDKIKIPNAEVSRRFKHIVNAEEKYDSAYTVKYPKLLFSHRKLSTLEIQLVESENKIKLVDGLSL